MIILYNKIENKIIIIIIKIEIYIVNNLRVNLLIGNNIIVPNYIVLYPGTGKIVIGSY